MPYQWVLDVVLFWVLSFFFEFGLLNAVQFKY